MVIPERFAPVLAELAPLAKRFREANARLYLVGGTVRDLLLDRATGSWTLISPPTRFPSKQRNLLQAGPMRCGPQANGLALFQCKKMGELTR